MTRVLITGIGIIAPSGLGRVAYWDAIVSGRTMIGRINRFDPTSYACQVGGQVDDALLDQAVEPRKQRVTSHASRLALVAAEQSLADARLSSDAYAPESIGVCTGTALGGWVDGEQQYGVLLERGAKRVNPFLVSGAGNHGPGIEVAKAIGAQGAQVTFSSGCISGLQALGYGASLISDGSLDVCVAGGTESPLSPMVIAALVRTQELSTTNDDPAGASRPFDIAHNGMVLTEGACFLVLESEQNAIRRGARVYAEIVGSLTSCDAQGMYAFDATGNSGGRAIHRLLRVHGLSPADLSYVCAHANGSPAFDHKETFVLKKALGEFAARVPITSIKGVLGHPFGAAGAFQVAAAALAYEHNLIPPTHNLTAAAPECDLEYVMEQPRVLHSGTTLITSYGYGGVNSYLILRRP
jgi:act minimal PKS ketosynthase (KS/KS alpha)